MGTTAHDFMDVPFINYADIRDQLRTGDLLLCSGRGPMSRMIQRATDSPWSHVALLARLESIERVLVLESVESIGVRAVPLSHYLGGADGAVGGGTQRGYNGELLIARHQMTADLTSERLRDMFRFAVDALGRRYDTAEILRIAGRILRSGLERSGAQSDALDLEHDDAYVCSEYVWECLHAAGIDVLHNGRGFIAPRDFAADPHVQSLWRLRHGNSPLEAANPRSI